MRNLPLGEFLACVLCLVPAVTAWRVFHPGLLDTDTADVYQQAVTGIYHDWHSPPFVVAMAACLKLGVSFKHLAILLAASLSVGVYRLASVALAVAWGGLPAWLRRSLAVCVPFLLCAPITPFSYWMVFVSSQGISAALVVWIAALSGEAFAASPDALPRRRYAAYLFALIASLAMLRPNMVLIVPVLALVPAFVLWPLGKLSACFTALALVVAPVAVTDVILNRFEFIRWHPEDQVMALDLVGLCNRVPEARHDFPFTDAMLLEDRYKTEYTPGFVNPMFFWHPRTLVKPGYLQWENHAKLRADYRIALAKYKPELLRLKWDAYLKAFDEPAWWGAQSANNDFALEFRPKYAEERKQLNDELLRLGNHERWRWVSGKHAVWAIASLVLGAVAILNLLARRSRRAIAFAAMLAVPVLVYAAYLPCTVAPFFRYLYPATLAVQVVAMGLTLGVVPAVIGAVARRLVGHAPRPAVEPLRLAA